MKESSTVTRRNFIRLGGRLALLGAAGGMLGPVGRFVLAEERSPEEVIKAGRPGDYAKPLAGGRPSLKQVQQSRVWIIRDAGGLAALVASCTHLGCPVRWEASGNQWTCPCHGSRYSVYGLPLAGPARDPLRRALLTLDAQGELVVDTTRPVNLNYRLKV